jgi:hypothetical protein
MWKASETRAAMCLILTESLPLPKNTVALVVDNTFGAAGAIARPSIMAPMWWYSRPPSGLADTAPVLAA